MRKYEALWNQLKEATHQQWVVVRLVDWNQHQTVINMIQLEKSKAQRIRKGLDLPAFGKLVIHRDPTNKTLKFRLEGAGHNL